MKEPEKVITTTCVSHCGGTCVLKVHVKDGVITWIETDDGDDLPPVVVPLLTSLP